jgi:hypothetical protein
MSEDAEPGALAKQAALAGLTALAAFFFFHTAARGAFRAAARGAFRAAARGAFFHTAARGAFRTAARSAFFLWPIRHLVLLSRFVAPVVSREGNPKTSG